MNNDKITLKWGTLKGWDLKSEAALNALEKYFAYEVAISTMTQQDTEEQFQALLELIDVADCDTIHNDWMGTDMTKEEAKTYLTNYRERRNK